MNRQLTKVMEIIETIENKHKIDEKNSSDTVSE